MFPCVVMINHRCRASRKSPDVPWITISGRTSCTTTSSRSGRDVVAAMSRPLTPR